MISAGTWGEFVVLATEGSKCCSRTTIFAPTPNPKANSHFKKIFFKRHTRRAKFLHWIAKEPPQSVVGWRSVTRSQPFQIESISFCIVSTCNYLRELRKWDGVRLIAERQRERSFRARVSTVVMWKRSQATAIIAHYETSLYEAFFLHLALATEEIRRREGRNADRSEVGRKVNEKASGTYTGAAVIGERSN